MGPTISRIINLPELKQSRIVAGKAGSNHIVEGLALMESADSASWLEPNSLIITNANLFKDTPEMVNSIMDIIASKSVAGIAIKENRYIREIPAQMREAADKYRTAIIMLPYHLTSTQIIRSISYEVFQYQNQNADYRDETTFIRDIIYDKIDYSHIISYASEYGWNLDRSMAAVVLCSDKLKYSDELIDLLIKCGYAFSFKDRNHIIAVTELNKNDARLTLSRIYSPCSETLSPLTEQTYNLYNELMKLNPDMELHLGIGLPTLSVSKLADSYYQARTALIMSLSSKNSRPLSYYGSIGVFSILLSQQNIKKTYSMVKSSVEAIRTYDDSKNADLLTTMDAFYENGMNIELTAKQLNVHNNTVRYRLSKVDSILNSDDFYQTHGMDLQILIKLMYFQDKYEEVFLNPLK